MKRERPEHRLVVEMVGVDEISQHPENANSGDVDLIQSSIQVNGLYTPITVQRSSGHIIVGNHRYLAAVKRGMRTVPVIYLDVDDLEAKRIMVVDNRSARVGYDDEGQLANLLEALHDTDQGLAGTGYDFQDYSALMELVNSPLEEHDFDLPDDTAEEPVLGHLNFSINPILDDDGKVREFNITREGMRHLTANDLNTIRRRLGQQPLNRFQLATYDIPDWKG